MSSNITNAKNEAVNGLIGLCTKAGKVVFGSNQGVDAIRSRKGALAILAEDSASATKKLIMDKCFYYNVPVVEYANKVGLGLITGKAPKSVLVITDQGLKEAILRRMGKDD